MKSMWQKGRAADAHAREQLDEVQDGILQMQMHKISWRVEMTNQVTIADANAQDQLVSRDDETAT